MMAMAASWIVCLRVILDPLVTVSEYIQNLILPRGATLDLFP